MFDISWGELMVVGVVGMAVTGRQDLPTVFRFVGNQLGRVVGLLQGARARVDQYAAQNELRQLQNELRSGLRELDQVRVELAVAASSQGMMGRTLGVTTPSANRVASSSLLTGPSTTGMTGNPSMMTTGSTTLPFVSHLGGNSGLVLGSTLTSPGAVPPPPSSSADPIKLEGDTGRMTSSIPGPISAMNSMTTTTSITSSSASHAEKAALEDEWEKQGIGYQTRAEQWYKQQRQRRNAGGTNSLPAAAASGSELLEALIKQNLLWDQYDRVVGEQDLQLQTRMAAVQRGQKEQQNTLIKETEDDETNIAKKE